MGTLRYVAGVLVLTVGLAGCTWMASGPGPGTAPPSTVHNTGTAVRRAGKTGPVRGITGTRRHMPRRPPGGGAGSRRKAGTERTGAARNAPGPVGLTSIQAGAQIFRAQCQTCHGASGVGTPSAPRLAKPSAVAATFPTQAQLEAFIQHNMPASAPGSLTTSQATQVAGYVWQISH
jgi:mono/diheme cytochrome c family protein